jgi:hypothetical protein
MNTTIIDDAEEASLSVAAICEVVAMMDEAYGKMMRIPKHLYGEYYLHEKAKHDARAVMMRYYVWKAQEWDGTLDGLKDRLVYVVAAFLTARPLRFSRKPPIRETDAVQLELVRNSLPCDFAYCEDFKEMCARFRKFNWWEGHIMKLDYDRYGKYFLQNYHKMTKEERQAFFDLDIMVELINKDIAKVMPKNEEDGPDDEIDIEELTERLKPIFYNNKDDVEIFLKEIKGMSPNDITDLVNRWVKEKRISEYGNSRKGDLWTMLNDAGLYTKSRQNWNRRVY